MISPHQIQTKPHGHGDVHALLYSSGLAAKWKADGTKWVCFFQVGQPICMSLDPACLSSHPLRPLLLLLLFLLLLLQVPNALVFHALIAALGVSALHDYDMNSLAVPRKAKEVWGGVACECSIFVWGTDCNTFKTCLHLRLLAPWPFWSTMMGAASPSTSSTISSSLSSRPPSTRRAM